jgi:hypothetical protein
MSGGTGCPSAQRSLTLRYRRRPASLGGRLSSVQGECAGGHAVTVFRKVKGPDRAVGLDQADGSGRYSIKGRRGRGRYYAHVTETTMDDIAICAPAVSRTLRRR